MWAACSPGGKSLRFSPIVTPELPSVSLIVAVPTLLPFASFSSTVTGVAAYAIAAPVIRPIRKARAIIFLFPPQRIFAQCTAELSAVRLQGQWQTSVLGRSRLKFRPWKPYRGKPAVRNFREGDGNVGSIWFGNSDLKC